ncbi:cobalt-precorrin-5B (C(1))-methyltransferase CbiD [Hippea maritima]|uniref:Cobalt-precorrin-5B C(1)-methyltransferase n=1 Tax=Hippea maritima (strain ATCC 700847 / DSM 10411 / MH2) TaxID=760142 RepID=F2LU89_HIPMA|nr:cobalt-precorrin-5B (C(1))-methyltransferase CbiD [Hippea maritima]AEA34552.1 cobalt-precorrin-6A synthase (deacetylating) [Hippea maritima DSM 10411]
MRKGFTTGTAAAAATKAAIIYKKTGKLPEYVFVNLPNKKSLKIPVFLEDGLVGVKKDAGDDPDITNNIKIFSKITIEEGKKDIIIDGGEGVGLVVKKGLQVDVGRKAINPVPQKMIKENAIPLIGDNERILVEIIVPDGKRIAKKTFNERLGIIDGISILGTTGIVEPMSVKALIASIECEIDVLVANNEDYFFLVPGRIGERHLKSLTDAPCVQVSNYFDGAFNYLKQKGIRKFGIAGHPGKIAKLAMGYYNTHSRFSPQAIDFVKTIEGIEQNVNTVEEICQLKGYLGLNKTASLVKERVKNDFGFEVDVILFDMKGKLVGRA